MTFLSRRVVPKAPPSLLKLWPRHLGIDERSGPLHPHERPGPRRDVGPALLEGRAYDRAAGVVGGGGDDVHSRQRRASSATSARRGPRSVPAATTSVSRLAGRPSRSSISRSQLAACGRSRAGSWWRWCTPSRRDRSGSSGSRSGTRSSRPARVRQSLGRVGGELVEGVELQELDAGACEHLGPGHTPEDLLHHALRAGVAVAHGVLDEDPAGFVDRDRSRWPSHRPPGSAPAARGPGPARRPRGSRP